MFKIKGHNLVSDNRRSVGYQIRKKQLGRVAVAAYVVTIPAGAVSATLYNYPVHIDLSRMPAAFWNNVRSDGGNIRAYSSMNGTRYPIDLPAFGRISKTGSLWVKVAAVPPSGTTFVIVLHETELPRVGKTDPYGAFGVWADYQAVFLGGVDASNRARISGLSIPDDPSTFDIVNAAEFSFPLEPHQGVAWDEVTGDVYTFDTNRIDRFNAAGTLLNSNTNPSGQVEVAAGSGTLGHCCDGTVIGNFIVIPINNYPSETKCYIAVFDKTTLALVRTFDASSISASMSSLCWNYDEKRIVSVNWGTISAFHKFGFDTITGQIIYAGSMPLTVSGTARSQIQGIEYYAGAYWLSDDSTTEIIRCETDGSYVSSHGLMNHSISGASFSGNSEGITRYKDGLLWLKDPTTAGVASFAMYFTPTSFAAGGTGANTLDNGGMFMYTGLAPAVNNVWTLAGTGWNNTTATSTRVLAAFGKTGSNGVVLGRNSTNKGTWDSVSLWLADGSWTNGQTFRLATVYQDTTRKLYRDGTFIASGTTTAQGNDFDYVALGGNGLQDQIWAGKYGFCYLRYEAMSDAWLAAEHKMMNAPATFYSIAVGNV